MRFAIVVSVVVLGFGQVAVADEFVSYFCIVRSSLESGHERLRPHFPPSAHPGGLARAVGGRKMLWCRGSDGKGSCDLWASSQT